MLFKALLWSIFFTSMYPLITLILKTFFNKQVVNMDQKYRKDLVPYIYCLIHHLYVVPFAFYHILADIHRTDDEAFDVNNAAVFANVFPFSFGYLVGDTLMYAIPEAMCGRYEYVLHHILGLSLTASAALVRGPMVRMSAHMLMLELSGIFLTFSWLFRNFGWRDTAVVKILEYCFSLAFFLLRIVHLPLTIFAYRHQFLTEYRLLGAIFIPVTAMQFFWFYKILGHLTGKKKDKSHTN